MAWVKVSLSHAPCNPYIAQPMEGFDVNAWGLQRLESICCRFTTCLGPYSMFTESFLIPDALYDGMTPPGVVENLLVSMGYPGFQGPTFAAKKGKLISDLTSSIAPHEYS